MLSLPVNSGFDRGELLSRWRAFLFVEGQADIAVVEELYGERLRRNAIMLTQVLGHRNHAGLVEMQLLIKGAATPIAALFDAITHDEIERIRTDAQHRAATLSVDDERATVARIAQTELENDRRIELLTVGEADIFDSLSESVICGLYPQFVGHEEAKAAFQEAGGGNAKERKAFYKREYGVPIPRMACEASRDACGSKRSCQRHSRSRSVASNYSRSPPTRRTRPAVGSAGAADSRRRCCDAVAARSHDRPA